MEMMLVAVKTYEREQTGEKVRSKHRMRAEKGMWNGGLVPYGFVRDEKTHVMTPDPEKAAILVQLFQLYIDTVSDHAVRDWLKARNIPSPGGNAIWTTSTVRDVLCNRRYAGEIEINKANKGFADLPDSNAYRIVKAPHPPSISPELFDMAHRIRSEKADCYPNHRGKSRSYARRQPDHVYKLQGLMMCSHCGHPMSPHYVFHKAGYGRRNDSYICHYVCAQYKKYGRDCDHANRILASAAEAWIIDRLTGLLEQPGMIERALQAARENSLKSVEPERAALAQTQSALKENQKESDKQLLAITRGGGGTELLGFLNQRAKDLKITREQHPRKSCKRLSG